MKFPRIHLNEAFMSVRIGFAKTWGYHNIGNDEVRVSGSELAETSGVSPAVLGSVWSKYGPLGELTDGLGFTAERRYNTATDCMSYILRRVG